jgi:peptide/nickel transport system substrate-binding protein
VDVARAAALLDEAGWRMGADGIRSRAGQPLRFGLLTVGSGDNALEQMLQASFRSIGVPMEIRQLELAAFLGVAQGETRAFDALLTIIPGDLALGHVRALLGGGPLAYPGYRSEALDAQLARARAATSEAELAGAWREAQRIIARDRPAAWLFHSRGLQGVNRRVRGVSIDLRGELAGVAGWSVDGGVP